MPQLLRVDVWPYAGAPDSDWLEDGGRAVDAFCRTATRVCAEIERALTEQGRPESGRTSSLRLMPWKNDGDDIEVFVVEDSFGDRQEIARVGVPGAVAHLDSGVRAQLVHDVIGLCLRRLDDVRGWEDGASIDRALETARGRRWQFALQGDWVEHRATGRQARLLARLDDDGYARLSAETATGVDADRGRVTPELVGWSTPESIARAERAFRFIDEHSVAIITAPAFGPDVTAMVDLDTGVVSAGGAHDQPRPQLESAGVISPRIVDVPRPLVEIGAGIGMLTADHHDAAPWHDALGSLVERFRADEWMTWWATAEVRTVFVTVELVDPGTRPDKLAVRRAHGKIGVSVVRSVDASGPARAAAEIATELVARARRLYGLTEPPHLD